MRKLIKAASISIILWGGSAVAQVHAQDILVYLTSGSTQTQGMAMVLSGQMVKKKAKVHILLCDDAGDLSLTNTKYKKLKPLDKSPNKLLDDLILQGVTVEVCALYLPNKTGMAVLKDGIETAKPEIIAEMLLNPRFKIFSF
ncbi:hypothetical protein [Aeromonas salmonicida]|uniref:hypothetical protein n=1 Tax=Aeromonas salmonicida TaxID=645 RepID=UPI0039A6FECB